MAWLRFRDIYSDDMGVIVESLPPVSAPKLVYETITVPGRDGDMLLTDDAYAPISYTVTLGVKDFTRHDDISAWLFGIGDLVLSSDPSRKYRARIVEGLSYEKVSRRFSRFNAVFTLQPFKYEAEPITLVLNTSGTVFNPGTRWSEPIIKVFGAGTFTIGGYSMTVSATAGEDSVTINSEIQECYYDLSTPRNNKVSGNFPRLMPGEVAVNIGTGISKVELTPQWRWY